ncbi:hypothetical protein BC827DRAFT_899665 [Russula dissimulans]|nr:hypothetical protein BC827DRAFT_899665 [Russula dissimulans]
MHDHALRSTTYLMHPLLSCNKRPVNGSHVTPRLSFYARRAPPSSPLHTRARTKTGTTSRDSLGFYLTKESIKPRPPGITTRTLPVPCDPTLWFCETIKKQRPAVLCESAVTGSATPRGGVTLLLKTFSLTASWCGPFEFRILNGRFMHKIERITVESVYIGYRQLTWHFTAYLQGRLRIERGGGGGDIKKCSVCTNAGGIRYKQYQWQEGIDGLQGVRR